MLAGFDNQSRLLNGHLAGVVASGEKQLRLLQALIVPG